MRKTMRRLIEGPFEDRQEKLAAQRQTWTFEQFRSAAPSTVPEAMLREIWDSLRRESAIDDFRPSPEDELVHVFGLADEDLDEFVQGILRRCNCRVPPPSETSLMKPVNTVADLVDFVAAMKM